MWGARPPGVHVPYRGGRKGAESAPNTNRTPRRERPGAAPPRRGDRPVLTGVKDTAGRYEAGKQGPHARVVARKGPRCPRPLTRDGQEGPGDTATPPPAPARPPLPRADLALDRARRPSRPERPRAPSRDARRSPRAAFRPQLHRPSSSVR